MRLTRSILAIADISGYTGFIKRREIALLHAEEVINELLTAMLDGMELFGMGYSWGGYESLIIPSKIEHARTAKPWKTDGPMLRIHAGLEDPDDLIADLEAGFARLRSNLPNASKSGESAAE